MRTILFLCGLHSMAFTIFHMLFWKLFHWKKELTKLSAVNSAIVQILNIRIIYFFLFVACICFLYPNELITSHLGHAFLAGISLFWLGRTIEQFLFFKLANKFVLILTGLFITGVVLFALPLLLNK